MDAVSNEVRADEKSLVQADQTAQLFGGLPVTLVSSAILAGVLVYAMWGKFSSVYLLGWLALFVTVSLSRAVLTWAYRHAPSAHPAADWLRWFRLGTYAISITWGMAGFFFFVVQNEAHEMVLIFVLTGVTIGGAIAYAIDMYCAIPFMLSVLLPVMLRLLMEGEEHSQTMGITVGVFVVFMVVSMRRIYHNMRDNIVLRIRSVQQVELLTAADAHRQRVLSCYSTLRRCNQAITECADEAELLQRICREVVGVGSFKMAWVGMVDQASQQVIPVAREGAGTEYLDGIQISVRADDPHGCGTTGTAIRENRPVWIQDFTQDPMLAPWHERGNRYQWGSVAALPLQCNGRAVGALMLYAGVADAFSEAEQHLLVSLATDISRALDKISLLGERDKSNEAIYRLAFYDPLTQLPNRQFLTEHLKGVLAECERAKLHCALVFLDVDHFKVINDTQGHAAGDELLIQVSQRLRACLRQGDSIARWGGDEFVVLLGGLSGEFIEASAQAQGVAEKIREELGKPYQLSQGEWTTSASIGVSMSCGKAETSESLFKHADIAMYRAKSSGRDAICFFDPSMQTLLDQRTVLENALRKAIESQQLHLYYQVQVDSLNRPIGAEVLLRWEHPEQGCLTPGSFMEIAEESGLILPIGLWVLVTACVQLNLWQANPLAKQLILAVNVSAKQFHQPDFVAQVERALWETGAPASLLKLELTESIVLENIQDTIRKMDQLKHLGVSIAIDDFGTGYSSLQYLKELPLNQIKIDQSFVRDIDDPKDAAIVQAIIVMTEKLGLNVIAEGVETHAQHDFLELAGCHHYQGYLFSKPIPLQAFEALLQTWSSAGHSQ